MKKLFSFIAAMTITGACVANGNPAKKMSTSLAEVSAVASKPSLNSEKPLIQIALLVDTSGSMKGLVDQARYQLWNVVSDLSKAKRGSTPIQLEIAVYQYGTEQVSKSRNCLRKIVDFTEDLDQVSQGLFSLHVGGGDEYCGSVIQASLEDLDWEDAPNVYKAIFIAGNEYFDQGTTTFGELLPKLKSKSVFVNTIYCGTKYDGRDQWDSAAEIAGGIASLINHNHRLPNIPTPYDKMMREINQEMNDTFLWYGKSGSKAAANQKKQDRNASKMSDHAFAARMSSKIGHLYHHIENDLVDAVMHKHVNLDKMEESKMPESFRTMAPSQRREMMDELIARRRTVRRKMAEVLSMRQIFLENEMSHDSNSATTVLGDALSNAIQKQAKTLGYDFTASEPLAAAGM